MQRVSWVTFGAIAVVLLGLTACGGRQPCRFVEIEDAEFEVELGDVDVERGEVEMVCGGQTIDVTWGEFRQRLNLDPGRYKSDLPAFAREVSCSKERRSRREVLCERSGAWGKRANLEFSFDD